ncbi:EthD family reductase [Methylobacterium sp. sgz302541]|uniref:EthD family reductase n=1 Tax=unclassified Methylobacterium TaxID=2615210 RepID=UPI003D347B4D
MILVSVMYPGGPGTTFDMAYYLGHHMPLVRERWVSLGLHEARIVRGVGTPDGGPAPVQVMALLTFDSAEAFAKAAAAHGEEIFGDIPNFTNTQPAVQINDFAEPAQGR